MPTQLANDHQKLDKFLSKWGRLFSVGATRRAFRTLFLSPLGAEYVVPDLAEFCRVHDPLPATGDLYELGRWAGRRDCWLHLRDWLELDEKDLTDLYAGRPLDLSRRST